MNSTKHAGVSHEAIVAAAAAVRDGAQGYDWDCTPGRWLLYTLLLAMPFPAVAVRPDPHTPVWQRHVRPTRKQQPDLRDMPILLPEISDAQYRLPVLVGTMFDVTILSRDALRPLADSWCSMAQNCLLRIGKTIRPMRAQAERRRAQSVLAAAQAGPGDADSTASSSSSTVTSDDEPP